LQTAHARVFACDDDSSPNDGPAAVYQSIDDAVERHIDFRHSGSRFIFLEPESFEEMPGLARNTEAVHEKMNILPFMTIAQKRLTEMNHEETWHRTQKRTLQPQSFSEGELRKSQSSSTEAKVEGEVDDEYLYAKDFGRLVWPLLVPDELHEVAHNSISCVLATALVFPPVCRQR
jgi:hypothetical protein